MTKRPNKTSLNPEVFDHGQIARQTATVDIPFAPSDPDAFHAVAHHIVELLPEPERSCVRMCAMRGISYAEAADLLEPELGRLVDKKQTWRWCQRGLDEVRQLLGTPWIGVLLEGRLPAPDSPGGTDGLLPEHAAVVSTDTETERGHGNNDTDGAAGEG